MALKAWEEANFYNPTSIMLYLALLAFILIIIQFLNWKIKKKLYSELDVKNNQAHGFQNKTEKIDLKMFPCLLNVRTSASA